MGTRKTMNRVKAVRIGDRFRADTLNTFTVVTTCSIQEYADRTMVINATATARTVKLRLSGSMCRSARGETMIKIKDPVLEYRCAVLVMPSEPDPIAQRRKVRSDGPEEIARCMSCTKKKCTDYLTYQKKKRRKK